MNTFKKNYTKSSLHFCQSGGDGGDYSRFVLKDNKWQRMLIVGCLLRNWIEKRKREWERMRNMRRRKWVGAVFSPVCLSLFSAILESLADFLGISGLLVLSDLNGKKSACTIHGVHSWRCVCLLTRWGAVLVKHNTCAHLLIGLFEKSPQVLLYEIETRWLEWFDFLLIKIGQMIVEFIKWVIQQQIAAWIDGRWVWELRWTHENGQSG